MFQEKIIDAKYLLKNESAKWNRFFNTKGCFLVVISDTIFIIGILLGISRFNRYICLLF